MPMKGCGRERVQEFETLLGGKFPDDYAKCLAEGLDTNEFRHCPVSIRTARFRNGVNFDDFNCLDPDPAPHVDYRLEADLGDQRCPPLSLIIGRDNTGEPFILSCGGKDEGTVYWASLEWGWSYFDNGDGTNPGVPNPEFAIALSFTEFLAWLRRGGDPVPVSDSKRP
jgi:hypothetical protein